MDTSHQLYASDLTDAEWALLEPLLLPESPVGRPRLHSLRTILEAGFKARRWVAERAHSWMNRFRRLLIRWDKKPENYLAFLHCACGLIAFRAAGLFG